ncbi:hypothetical protein [Methylobacterium nodulans]|uniref:Uncharacterized protein n=1 Tax=Methylobacterium nodulans (strain LMG 21967 / CNCM I-2342 / ORS 2060) TaxID=460265 RepID=B8IKR7_METNO|nr:hypothetical protein [Methylobacterium nodulans]ACL56274.1 conserved hypothetical protein [Methylobacterium nodulans ORS 2060]
MTSLTATPFPTALFTADEAGPSRDLRTVEEARRFVERERLPVVRSGVHWLDVYNRLTLAQATKAAADIEAARAALAEAFRREAADRVHLAA